MPPKVPWDGPGKHHSHRLGIDQAAPISLVIITESLYRGELVMVKIIYSLLLFLALVAQAQTPIPRQGDSCPSGTYKSGDYCKQFPSSVERGGTIIQKSGNSCPSGFYSSGHYCKRFSSSDEEVIPREKGDKCPTGWRKSGGYCVEI